MEKKKYTKPGIVKVELRHEQAVIGTCSAGVTDPKRSAPVYCLVYEGPPLILCKQFDTQGDSTSTS